MTEPKIDHTAEALRWLMPTGDRSAHWERAQVHAIMAAVEQQAETNKALLALVEEVRGWRMDSCCHHNETHCGKCKHCVRGTKP